MPLLQSAARAAVDENIARERAAGKPERQAVAIALDVHRRNRGSGGSAGDVADPDMQALVLLPSEMGLSSADRRSIAQQRLQYALIGPMARQLQRHLDGGASARQPPRWQEDGDWKSALDSEITPEWPDPLTGAQVDTMEQQIRRAQMPGAVAQITMSQGGFPRARYDDGGAVAPPVYMGANPQTQQLYQRIAAMPLNQLQQLAVRMPPNTPQGQMIQRAMKAKQMAPVGSAAFPSVQGPQQQGFPSAAPASGGAPAAVAGNARGGGVRRFGDGGSTGGQGGGVTGFFIPPNSAMLAAPNGQSTNPGTVPAGALSMGPALVGPIGSFFQGTPGGASAPMATAAQGFPYAGASAAGTATGSSGAIQGGNGVMLPTTSFSVGNPGEVGPTWSPGQALLSPSSQTTTAPPGFGGTPATPPLATPLPPSVLNAQVPAAAPAPASAPSLFAGLTLPPGMTQQQATAFLGTMPSNITQQGAQNLLDQQAGIGPLANTQSYARGGAQRRAMGGLGVAPTPEQRHETYHPGGFINSPVAGRTDHLPLGVPVDSHVIPADIVSGIGQGNSLNGAALLDRIFHHGPWGARAIKSGDYRAPRSARRVPSERTTSILAAGGEYIVRPEAVARVGQAARRLEPQTCRGKSDVRAGHDAIDAFILSTRKHAVATTRKLPGPVKS